MTNEQNKQQEDANKQKMGQKDGQQRSAEQAEQAAPKEQTNR